MAKTAFFKAILEHYVVVGSLWSFISPLKIQGTKEEIYCGKSLRCNKKTSFDRKLVVIGSDGTASTTGANWSDSLHERNDWHGIAMGNLFVTL